VPIGLQLELVSSLQKFCFFEHVALKLQSDRQSGTRKSAGKRDRGDAGEVRRRGVDIGQVHRQWVLRVLANFESRCGHGRAGDQVDFGECFVVILLDQTADFGGFFVQLVVVAGGQRVSSQQGLLEASQGATT